jgi:hypothetical protein
MSSMKTMTNLSNSGMNTEFIRYMKCVINEMIENFGTFPESTNTLSSNQRFRNYGH